MSGAPKYRKKPVVIEAMRFDGLDSYLAIVDWMKASGDTHALADEVEYRTPIMLINTLEGTMAASPGDYVIRGVKGEFYPCKPDIFAATYEVVTPSPLHDPWDSGCSKHLHGEPSREDARCSICRPVPASIGSAS